MDGIDQAFELKLADGRVVRWHGKDGIDAAIRYVDTDRTATVIAWRDSRDPQDAIRVGIPYGA